MYLSSSAALDRYRRGVTGHVARPARSIRRGYSESFRERAASQEHLAAEEAAKDVENAMGNRPRNNAAAPGRDQSQNESDTHDDDNRFPSLVNMNSAKSHGL